MTATVMAEGLRFPEGPVVYPDGSVIVVEILGGALTRVWGDGRKEVVATPEGGPNGAAVGPDGALYVCNNGGFRGFGMESPNIGPGRIERVDVATGKVDRLYTHVGEHALSSPNDIVFDAQGGFWFTDLGAHSGRRRNASGLYYAKPDGSHVVEVVFGAVGFNGVGLSPDGTELYVADTFTARLWAYRIEGPGKLAGEGQPLGRLAGVAPGDTGFDSLGVTAAGNVCVATLKNVPTHDAPASGGISSYDPATRACEFTPLDDAYVTNIAFGGADMKKAHVTLSGTGRLVRTDWSEPGLKLNFNPY